MKIIKIRDIDRFASLVIPKPTPKNKKSIEKIISDVQKTGDLALRKYEKKFGGKSKGPLRVSSSEIKKSYKKVSQDEIRAIKLTKKLLTETESSIKKSLKEIQVKTNGVKISKLFIPISSVGCYVPGGSAKYPSSLVMSVIPAKVAGVKRIVVVSPSDKNGVINPITLVAADICGVNEIYKVGGAQAIAALAYGTKSLMKVDKIVGPGSTFVSTAKSIVSSDVSIDMIAGPTELGIIVDNSANPDLVAADLISQAEHSEDTFCFALTTSEKIAKEVVESVAKKIKLIKRKEIVRKSLQKNGFVAICNSEKDVIRLANNLAPEHLEIITKKPKAIASKISSAGLILIGGNTPSSASDYLLGSNHILPTSGFGKTRGSLSVMDFMKLNTKVESSMPTLRKISKYMNAICDSEGLPNHYEAVRSRLR